MNKLDMISKNKIEQNIDIIKALFPNCISDGKVNFDVLKQELSVNVDEETKEKYQLTWPGKKQAILTANKVTTQTLRPLYKKSELFNSTKNTYIEGDNLEVLKILQDSYLEKIKCIYIDPPYNTGNDFIYDDKFYNSSIDELKISGQLDDEGFKLITNSVSNGRFHSDWLSMMYSRLKILRNLLKSDGLIFISIDDNEVHNLKTICNEIFGESNFIAQLIWQNKKGGGNDSVHIAIEHEYILCYAKNKSLVKEFYELYDEDYIKRYKEEDEIGKYFWDTFKRKSGKQYYPIICPDGTILEYDNDGNPISWLRSKPRYEEDIKNGEIRIIKVNNNWSVQFKQRMPKGKKPRSIFKTISVLSENGTTSDGSQNVYELFKKNLFSNPKPVDLIKFLLGFSTSNEDIILDVFSGSATTAHAVMQLNAEDGGNRKYIMVQVPEKCDEKSDAFKLGYSNICEIGQERIRRAAKKIKEETNADIDYGFRVYKVDSSNMKDIFYKPADLTQLNILDLASNIKEDRTSEDLLTQVILDLGLTLDLKIEEKNILNNIVYFVENNSLIACFDDNVNIDIIDEICKYNPLKVVFKDISFKSDKDKINLEERIKKLSPETEISIL